MTCSFILGTRYICMGPCSLSALWYLWNSFLLPIAWIFLPSLWRPGPSHLQTPFWPSELINWSEFQQIGCITIIKSYIPDWAGILVFNIFGQYFFYISLTLLLFGLTWQIHILPCIKQCLTSGGYIHEACLESKCLTPVRVSNYKIV